jgi:hypothetical protein
VSSLFSHVVESKSLKLWTNTANRAEYLRMRRLIGLDTAKNILDDTKISEALLENGITRLAAKDELLILHDGSDIRKEHASKLEDLGKVRGLNGKIINGYSSFNTVAVDLSGKDITLLSTEIYSNRSESFIPQKDLKLISKPLSKKANAEQAAHYKEITAKVVENEYINSSIVAKQQLKRISVALKEASPDKRLTHVIDRGSDDDETFKLIDGELNDEFVIRLKSSRLAQQQDELLKEKLVNKKFKYKNRKNYPKIQIKSKVYKDASCIVEWGEQLNGYNIVRVQLLTSDGKAIFKLPMLLISNKEVTSAEQATSIYHIYLKRPKIEGVFKFLKEVLGWEDSQIREYSAIKTLLTFCYFVAGYFYEIESALVENDTIKFIAYLGGGKGNVTRTYVLRGFAKMITKVTVDEAIDEFNITPEQIQEIMLMMMRGY